MPYTINYAKTLATIRLSWLAGFGAITLMIFLGLWVPHLWMPLVGAVLVVGLIRGRVIYMGPSGIACSIVLRCAVLTIAWSALVMLTINILNTRWVENIFVDETYNIDIPFISAVIVYPIAAIVSAYLLLTMRRSRYCRDCTERMGMTFENGIHRNIHHNEARLQLTTLMGIAVLMTVVTWWYFLTHYRNTNISTPDKMYFFYLPVLIYALSAGFAISRYGSMHLELSTALNMGEIRPVTQVRFMVVRGDKILMVPKTVPSFDELLLWDTPAVVNVNPHQVDTESQVAAIFAKLSGLPESAFTVRRLFVTAPDTTHPIFHYAAFITEDGDEVPEGFLDKQTDKQPLPPEWLTLYTVDKLLNTNMLARPMAFEIHRVYTVTMAWKTYDRSGHRLYPIRNYRPTFRLSDFHTWEVDYSDPEWLYIAENNEDRPFFRLRRLWHRFTHGR